MGQGSAPPGAGSTHPIYEAKIDMQARLSASTTVSAPQLDRWSTAGVSPGHRLEYWREVISKAVIATSVSKRDSGDFLGEITCRKFNDITFNCFDSGGHEIIRSESHIRNQAERRFLLSLQLSGKAHITQGGRSIVLSPGTMGLVDAGQPFSVVLVGEVRRMVAVLPHQLVWSHFPRVTQMVALQIDPLQPCAEIIRDYVIRLSQPQCVIGGVAGDVMSEHLCALLGIVAASQLGVESPPSSSRQIRKDVLLRYLRRQALDPELSPSRAAKAVGMSVRSLHDLMQHTGQSFSEWILDARVTHARRLLQSPGAAQRKIADIATDCGFSDLSHFNRMFKARVGCTPREARLVCRAAEGPPC
jgi:AraC family transcriptional activator of tynA and feaB